MVACTACAAQNPAVARFCMVCGAPLERRCSSCGEPVAEGARFCMACGTPVDDVEAAGTERSTAPASSASTGAAHGSEPTGEALRSALDERRTVTVLFADLSGYTA